MDPRKVYETGLQYHHYANTAYPLTPHSFMQYRLKDESEIYEFIREEWKSANEISLYIHVPFCKSRCKFCEYVVLEGTDESTEDEYTELLLKEMEMYAPMLKGKTIVGYDLGGGTPTKLSVTNLTRITAAVKTLFNVRDDVIFSIETTPLIAANEPEKLCAVYEMGYRRISMGVQTVSEKLLNELGRDGSKSLYEKAVENIRKAGFERFNIDLMYGFLHQTDSDFDNTLRYAIRLNPEYITLYRNRYKGTKLEFEAGGVSLYKAMAQYRIAHRVLTENGFMANIGKNTFSRIENDYGTSDYLTRRVIDGTPYLGMGLGAQSFGMNYLAYNLGAAEKKMERYKKAICENRLPVQDVYRLPLEESAAKMVSVSFYFAFVDLVSFKKRFGVDFEEMFPEEVGFVLENGLMKREGDRLMLTDRGADYINGVIPLFYSENSKKELEKAFSKNKLTDKTDEELFLSAYNINDYDRPSVATDTCVFSLSTDPRCAARRLPAYVLSILLIKRGEHPYMNSWALPGGFLKNNETLEECALREIQEETGFAPEFLIPVGTFSKPDRDVRGRIISNAYASILTEEKAKVMGGSDTIDARWFRLYMTEPDDGISLLTLTNSDITLSAKLRLKKGGFGHAEYEIEESNGLAFDHASIIASALALFKKQARNFDFLFDFLPEKFTLSELQSVQETLLGITLLPANFRRKAEDYVEQTDEFTSGDRFRPARLFRRKG